MSGLSKFMLFKRSNGKYYIICEQDGRKRWKSTGCSTKHDALKALSHLQELVSEKAKPKLLSKFTLELLDYLRTTFDPATVEIYVRTLAHLKNISGDIPLSDISPRHFDAYKSQRLQSINSHTVGTDKERTISPITVNIELRALRAAFRVAVRWKVLDRSPFDAVQFAKVPEATPTYILEEDFRKLIEAVNKDWLREIIVFAVLTGMRRGEITNLRWQDLDLQNRVIQVQSNSTFRTKHGKRRVVPMNNVVFDLLLGKSKEARSIYVFETNGDKIADDHVCKQFKHYVRKCNLPMTLHFHSLRHTFASWLAQDGVSLYAIQKLLGHSSSNVTQVYSHLLPDQLHSTVNRISY